MHDSPDAFSLPPPELLPEWRQNPTTGQWVIIAPERATRPVESIPQLHFSPLYESCPFCSGQEQQTPPEIFAIRSVDSQANGPGWRVRVVPNRYPALRTLAIAEDQVPNRHLAREASSDFSLIAPSVLNEPRPGFGKHELIIECGHHESSLANLPADHICDVVNCWRQRISDLSRDQRFQYAHLFKNHGFAAGASVIHAHSQLIALPFVPPFLQLELERSAAYHALHGNCIYCEITRSELAARERLVVESSRFVALAAYAGRQPYETWILPRCHQCRFDTIGHDAMLELGGLLWELLGKLGKLIQPLAYNVILHTAPFHREPLAHFHWHLEILPRTAQTAGFEWGTGLYINTLRPEEAAQRLRNQKKIENGS